jgi:hypothetical protein
MAEVNNARKSTLNVRMYSDCSPCCFASHFDLVLIDCRYKTNGAEWDWRFLTAVARETAVFLGRQPVVCLKYTDVADEPATFVIRVHPNDGIPTHMASRYKVRLSSLCEANHVAL